MKLALVRSLDAGDPLTPLGRKALSARKKFISVPAYIEVAPEIFQGPDGKFETQIDRNHDCAPDGMEKAMRRAEILSRELAEERKIAKSHTLYAMYTGDQTWFQDDKQTPPEKIWREAPRCPGKSSTNVRSFSTEREAWERRGRKPRTLADGERFVREALEDGYVILQRSHEPIVWDASRNIYRAVARRF